MMRIGDQLQISINNSCQVQGTVTDIKTIGENGKRYFRLTSFGTYENTVEAMTRFQDLLETK